MEEQAEVLESLPLGAICFGDSEKLTSVQRWPLEDWKDHYPYWNEPNILARESIGDCYSMIIDSILTLNAPFPGDEWYHPFDLRPELRFYVRRKDETRDCVIDDRLTGNQVVVAQCLMENHGFDIGFWYAEKCAQSWDSLKE